MVLSRTRFKFVKIVVKAEKFGNGSFQGQRSACYVTVHRKSEKWAPRALSLTCDNMLVHCCSKDTGGFPNNDKKINLKHCNSPFLELSQNIKAKTFVLKHSKFRFPLLCLISQCTSISILHLEQRQNSVTQGQGHKKSLSPTLVASWTLRSCSFWVWFPFKQCDKATAAHQFDNGSGLETRYKLSC